MSDHDHHPEHLSDRIKDISNDLKEQFSSIEQEPPNKPSFLLVVILFAVTIIIVFILAIFFLHLDRGRLFRHLRKHPTSQLILPSAPASQRGALT